MCADAAGVVGSAPPLPGTRGLPRACAGWFNGPPAALLLSGLDWPAQPLAGMRSLGRGSGPSEQASCAGFVA